MNDRANNPGDFHQFLAGRTIGLSASASEDLEALGMNQAVLGLAYVELARHLLAHGACLAYGGDLRQAGYTQQLFDLVRTYELPGLDSGERVTSYLSWPIHLELGDDDRIDLLDIATLVEMPLDAALQAHFGLDAGRYLPPDSNDNRHVWAHCLTAMRQQMTDHIDARIVLGGQSTRFLGRYPGIAEEALLAVDAGMPTYVLGGFGGCAADLATTLGGAEAERLTGRFQFNASPQAKDNRALRDAWAAYDSRVPIDYEALTSQFADRGIAALGNGLSTTENQVLFRTDDIDEIIALVLRGLRRQAA